MLFHVERSRARARTCIGEDDAGVGGGVERLSREIAGDEGAGGGDERDNELFSFEGVTVRERDLGVTGLLSEDGGIFSLFPSPSTIVMLTLGRLGVGSGVKGTHFGVGLCARLPRTVLRALRVVGVELKQ